MSIQAREPGGTSAGGRFAAQQHSEVAVEVCCEFNLSDDDHIEMATEAVNDAWMNSGDTIEDALDAIATACDRHGIGRPSALSMAFSDRLSNLVQNRWHDDEPDMIDEASDRVGPAGPTWKGVGISPAESVRWSESEVTDPTTAAALRQAGVTPFEASWVYSDTTEGDPITIGRAVSSGVISPAAAATVASAGPPGGAGAGPGF